MRKLAGLSILAVLAVSAAVAVAIPVGTPREGPDIVGTDNADTLNGTIKPERVFALAGNDLVRGNAGGDYLDGGRGVDTIYGDSGNDQITGEVCNQTRCDPPENDVLHGGVGDDTIEGNTCREDVFPAECPDGSAIDVMYGDNGNDTIYVRAPGRSRVYGGAGNDRLSVRVEGGADDGGQTFSGGSGRDRIFSGRGRDRISVADHEVDTVSCGLGSDYVTADRKDHLRGCEHVSYRR